MRRFNSILALVTFVLAIVHILLGSLQLLGAPIVFPTVISALATAGCLAVHVVLSVTLLVKAAKGGNALEHFKLNRDHWMRYGAALLMLMLLFSHAVSYGMLSNGSYVKFAWNFGTFAINAIFLLALAAHLILSARPISMALGFDLSKTGIFALQLFVFFISVIGVMAFAFYTLSWI